MFRKPLWLTLFPWIIILIKDKTIDVKLKVLNHCVHIHKMIYVMMLKLGGFVSWFTEFFFLKPFLVGGLQERPLASELTSEGF